MTTGASMTSEISDSSEDLSPSNPLSEPLALCGRALSEPFARESSAAAKLAESRLRFQRIGAECGTAAILLVAVELVLAAGTPPAGSLAMLLRGAELGLGLAAIVLSGLAAMNFGRKKQLVAAHRSGICALLKFRFLIDPDLWSRRGSEADERRNRLTQDARSAAAATESDARSWISAGTAPYHRELPVGSNIDPHSVHVLVDYYQARRLNPALARLAEQAGAAARTKSFSRRALGVFFFAAVAALAIHAGVEFQSERAGASAASLRELSLVLAGLAVFLPAAGAAVKLAGGNDAAAGSRSASRHHSLSSLSERLQKVSGAEAIFRELNFCEDLLEGEARENLLRLAEPGG